jgi:hypothetical protein
MKRKQIKRMRRGLCAAALGAMVALFLAASGSQAHLTHTLADFVPSPSGNGRAVAFDLATGDLFYTITASTNIYITDASNSPSASVDPGVLCGALAWDAKRGKLWCGAYDGSGDVFTVDPSSGAKTLEFTFTATDSCYGPGVDKFYDGLAYDEGPTLLDADDSLWLSGDAARDLYQVTLTGVNIPPSPYAVPTTSPGVDGCNTGIAVDGQYLWLALQSGPDLAPHEIVRVAKSDPTTVLSRFTFSASDIPGPEDLELDVTTFAPDHCVLWSNEFGSTNHLKAWGLEEGIKPECPGPTPPPADLQKLSMEISGPAEIPVSEQVFYGVDEVLLNRGPNPRVDVRDIKKLDCPHPGDPPPAEAAFPTQCSWVFDRLVEEIEVMQGVQYYLKRDIDGDGKCDPPKRRWFVGEQDHQQIPRSQLPPTPPDDPDPGPVKDGDCIVADSTPGVFKEIGVKKQVVLHLGEPVPIHEEFDVHCTGPSFHTFTLQDRIEAKDPRIIDPDPTNNALERQLRVACIAQADLAIVAWDVPSELRAKVSERLFFETKKTLHNFGPFGPVDADVWKTMVVPPDAEGSVHVTPAEAPATIVIERADGTREVRENQPASTTVFVEGPASLSIHFKVRGLEVSRDRVVSEDFDVHCLRADRFVFTLTNEVMPQDPHARDPNEANNRATRTVVLSCPIEEGRMTGGGSVFTAAGQRVTHGFELHCDATDAPNNLQVNFGGSRFHLETLTSAFCSDAAGIDPGQPPAPFDTYEGTGAGRCNGQPASITWKFTDAGEPGDSDTAEISISGACTLTVSGALDRGNHQAHPE